MADILRVFISSTTVDLKAHRQHAMDACLRQGMLPIMMEHLPAADTDAVGVSLKMVEESDIYVGIFGRRYGYVPANFDQSITELEYEHAVKLGLPRLIFIMDDAHPATSGDSDTHDATAKLTALLARLKTERVVSFFDSPDKLLAYAINSLSHLRLSPRSTAIPARESDAFSDPIKAEMSRLNKTIDRLTIEQYRVLDYLTGQRRVAITGCAGSGKTLIAVEKAIRLSRAGLRTLILCHNPHLAAHMRRMVQGEKLQVYDFAEWVGQLTGKSLMPDGTWNHYYWPTDDDLLEAAEFLLVSTQRFDAVIVDEGQDFRDEWWLVVESALVNPEHDILYIFHDNNQALLPHQTKYPVTQSPITLSQNCRNAGHIFTWVRQFHFRLEQHAAPELEGKGIVHKTVFAAGDEVDAVREAVRRALEVIQPERLIVLSAEVVPAEHSILNGLEITQRFNWTWQEAVRNYLQTGAKAFNTTEPLPALSDAPVPTQDDIEAVVHFATQITGRKFAIETSKRMWWVVEENKFQLSPAPHRHWMTYFTSPSWANGLPEPKMFQLSLAGNRPNTIRLADVSSYKGLEADGVILFVQSPREKLSANLYVGLSRARYYVHLVVDPVSNARLPQLEMPPDCDE